MFSRKPQVTQSFVSSGVAIFAFITAIAAVDDGISPLTAQSAQLQLPLMVLSTWNLELAADERIYTAHVTSKESVEKSTRALCA